MTEPRIFGARLAAPALAGMAAAALTAVPVAGRAQEGLWAIFEARCLTPHENFFEPVVDGLEELPVAEGWAYALPGGGRLVLERAPADGASACRVEGADADDIAAFRSWVAGAVSEGRYDATGPDTWESRDWIEPRLRLELRAGPPAAMRVVETELES